MGTEHLELITQILDLVLYTPLNDISKPFVQVLTRRKQCLCLRQIQYYYY